MRAALFLCLATLAPAANAALLDRIAVTVDSDVITETEVYEEIRVVALQNGNEPDFSPAARRVAADRLVDQDLIRKEMRLSNYPQPSPADVQKMLNQLRKQRFHADDQAYRQALDHYGLTGGELRAHLAWQLMTLRFADLRFEVGTGAKAQDGTDQDLEAWLKLSRTQSRIRFHEEAFQ